MERKRWTAKTIVDETVLAVREKRKWQIALRRYVLEGNKSSHYAPYFGLDIKKFRQWIETQFDHELNWDNFSSAWQFDHVVPVAYFDFSNEEDLRLCWNFVNIRVDKKTDSLSRRHGIDVLAAKKYFDTLYKATGYEICHGLIKKIAEVESTELESNEAMQQFITGNLDYLKAVQRLGPSDYDRLNTGTELRALLFEKDFLKRLGS